MQVISFKDNMLIVLPLLILLLVLVFGHGVTEAGPKIVALQSLSVKPYEEALAGFKSVCNAEISRIVLSEQEEVEVVKIIDRNKPEIVLAIGMDALTRAKPIADIPVLYLMVLNPQALLSEKRNISGVSMNISQEQQVAALLEVLPATKRIGILYDPERTRDFVKQAEEAVRKRGLTLMAEKIHSPQESPSRIKDFRGRIDVFWMIPDITVLTPETVEFLLLFSLENNIPILTFSEKYVELGALLSVSIDPFDIGVQAGEMAKEILSGSNAMNGKQVHPRRGVVTINRKIAGKLGITIDERVIKKARIVE